MVFAADLDRPSDGGLCGTGNYELFLVNLDQAWPIPAQNWIRLTETPKCDENGVGRNVQNWWPSWSPDGTRVAFMSNLDETWRIYVIEVFLFDESSSPLELDASYRLTQTTNVTESEPAWSPDGRNIAYVGGCGADQNIFLARVFQSNPQLTCADLLATDGDDIDDRALVLDLGSDREPSWSPRGDFIAYTSYSEWYESFDEGYFVPNIHIKAVNDGKLNFRTTSGVPTANLTGTSNGAVPQNAYHTAPSWSPYGNQIAFASTPTAGDGRRRMYILNVAITSIQDPNAQYDVQVSNYDNWSSAPRTNQKFFTGIKPIRVDWSQALECEAYIQGQGPFFGEGIIDPQTYRSSDPSFTRPCLELYKSLIFWAIYNETSEGAFQIPDYLKAALPPQLAQDPLFGDVYMSARLGINAVLDTEVRPVAAGRGDPINYFTQNYKGSIGNIFSTDPTNNNAVIANAQLPQWHVDHPTLVVPLWAGTCDPHPSVAIRQQLQNQGAILAENDASYYVLNTIDHISWFDDQIECFMNGSNGDDFYQDYMDMMPIIHAAIYDHLYDTRADPTNGAYNVRGANIGSICTEFNRQAGTCTTTVVLNLNIVTTVGTIMTVNQVTGDISQAVCAVDNDLKAYERQLDVFYYQGETPNNRRETTWYIASDGPSIHVHVFRSDGGQWVTRTYQQPSHRNYPPDADVRRRGGFITRLVGADLGSVEFQSSAYGTQRDCG